MGKRNLAVLAAGLAIMTASFFGTSAVLGWRDRAAEEACFAAPAPDCLIDAAERRALRAEDRHGRAGGLLAVALARGRVGDRDGMRRVLEQATDDALEITEEAESDITRPDRTLMANIAAVWAGLGERDRALKLAHGTDDPLLRNGRREALIGRLVRDGDFPGALAAAMRFENSIETARFLTDITRAQLAAGGTPDLDPTLARLGAIADLLANETEQAEARALVGQLQALAGRTEDALATADALGHEHRRDWIIQNAMLARVRAGKLEEAVTLVEFIADPAARMRALFLAANDGGSESNSGKVALLLAQAEAIAATIEDEARRAEAMEPWVYLRVQYDESEELLDLIAAMKDRNSRDFLYMTRSVRLAEVGNVTEALDVTRLISEIRSRAVTLATVALRTWENGDDGKARDILDMAIAEAISLMEDSNRSLALQMIVSTLVQASRLDEAEKVATRMSEGDFSRDMALSSIAYARAMAGDIEGAAAVLGRMSANSRVRKSSNFWYVVAKARTGNIGEAIEMAEGSGDMDIAVLLVLANGVDFTESSRKWRPYDIEYSDPPQPPPRLPEGWNACLAAPTNECILTLVDGLARDGEDPYLLHRAAVGWARIGQTDKAYETMTIADERVLELLKSCDRLRESCMDFEFVRWQISAWADIGDLDRAAVFVASLDNELGKSLLANEQIRAGKIEAAKALAERTEDPGWRIGILDAIAKAQIENGNIAGARNTILQLRRLIDRSLDRYEYTALHQSIALLEVGAGRFEEATRIAAALEAPGDRDRLLRSIVEILAEKRQIDIARHTLRDIDDPLERVRGYAGAAVAIAKGGDDAAAGGFFEEALALAEELPAGEDRDRAFGSLAERFARAGDFSRTIAMLPRIEDDEQRADASLAAVRWMIDAGESDAARNLLQSAIEMAEAVSDPQEREDMLGEIAERCAEAGDFEGALQLVESIEDSQERDVVLREIAVDMARLGDMNGAMEIVRGLGLRGATALARIASPDPYDR